MIRALFLLGLLGCASTARETRPAESPRDATPRGAAVVYTNAIIHREDGHIAHALRVEGGRITHVLEHEDEALSGARVDLGGATILPGLTDAHFHLTSVGQSAREIDLREATSIADVVALVRDATRTTAPGTWIRGTGWDQNDWPGGAFPDRTTLDEATPEHPVWLSRIDGHAVLVNHRALALAGVTRETRAPDGGAILRDARGEPSGVLVDAAIDLVSSALPSPSRAEIREDTLTALERCARVGLTAVHDMGTTPDELAVLRDLEREGRLTLRVYVYLGGEWSAVEHAIAAPVDHEGLVRVVGVKLFADGALGSRGAALLAPYDDDPETRGLFVTAPEALVARAIAVHRAGYQLAIHAIGDAGNRAALDAIEAAQGDDRSRRHRIEHAQVVAPDDIPRFAALGVVASMQPTHATSDMPWAEARIGRARLRGAYAPRTLLDSGARVVFGSDAPVESESPWLGLHAAVERTDLSGAPRGGFRPEERLDVARALALFTRAPNEIVGRTDLGTIQEGAIADLVVVSPDPLSDGARTHLSETRVLRTILGGEVISSR